MASGAPAHVSAQAWLVPPVDPVVDGWRRLPDVRRDEIDPRRQDPRFSRLDRAARLLLLAARVALGDRSVAGDATGIVLGTITGSLEADRAFDASRRQPEGASPALFPATLATAPIAEASMRLGLRGPALCISAGHASLVAAVAHAARVIVRGEADVVLAAGLEVASPAVGAVLGRPGPFVESVALFVLERDGIGPRIDPLPPLDELGLATEPPPGAFDLLGNRGAPALVAALAGRVETVVRVTDGLGFSAALRIAPPGGAREAW